MSAMDYLSDVLSTNWFLVVKLGMGLLIGTLIALGIRYSLKGNGRVSDLTQQKPLPSQWQTANIIYRRLLPHLHFKHSTCKEIAQ